MAPAPGHSPRPSAVPVPPSDHRRQPAIRAGQQDEATHNGRRVFRMFPVVHSGHFRQPYTVVPHFGVSIAGNYQLLVNFARRRRGHGKHHVGLTRGSLQGLH